MSEESEDDSPGWDAIDRALAPVYGDVEPPFHYGTMVSALLGGPDPIEGISVYRSNPFRDHWHFVTYGFSELFEKEFENKDVSGWGFELTFRVARGSEDEPYPWAINFLQNLGRYVFSTGNVFGAGDYMNANGPLRADAHESLIRAFVTAHDPQLPERIETPYGCVKFVQVFGITLDELAVVKRWNGTKFIEMVAQHVPGLVTSLDRKSLLADPEFARAAEEGIARDGSSTGLTFASRAGWEVHRSLLGRKRLTITLSATAAAELIAILPLRIGFDRDFALLANQKAIRFTPAGAASFAIDDNTAVIALSAAHAKDLAANIQPKRGEYSIGALPNVTFIVEPSTIRDSSGNAVESIG